MFEVYVACLSPTFIRSPSVAVPPAHVPAHARAGGVNKKII